MRDPLILTARFRWEMDDWWAKTRTGRRIELCWRGPWEWFDISPRCRELWVVISPYRDDEYAYPIVQGWTLYILARESGETTDFYRETASWILKHIRKFPQYQWYLSIEVEDD